MGRRTRDRIDLGGRAARLLLAATAVLVVGAAAWLVLAMPGGWADAGDGSPGDARLERAAAGTVSPEHAGRDDDRTRDVGPRSESIVPLVDGAAADDGLRPREAAPVEGRTARLTAVITVDGVGTPAELHLEAGPERGRVLVTDDAGRLPETALLPGAAIVSVRVGADRCRRELLLRHRKPTALALDFADRGYVEGLVRDEDGAPVAGAAVSLDGVTTFTDPAGRYACARRASGPARLVVRAAGLVDQQRLIGTDGPVTADVTLARGGTLVLDVEPATGLSGDVRLTLVPSGDPTVFLDGRRQPTFPWSDLHDLSVPVGGRLVLADLPACGLRILGWHERATTREASAWISPGLDADMALTLRPLPTVAGRVLRDGEPVPGARVRLAFANPARERSRVLGDLAREADRRPVALPPVLDQDVVADAEGRFTVALDPAIRHPGHLRVEDPAGTAARELRLETGADEVVVELGVDAG